MSSPDQKATPQTVQKAATEAPHEPFTPIEARRTEADSLLHAAESAGEVMERHRAGRVEAETRRITEEVTREARDRLKVAREQAAPAQGWVVTRARDAQSLPAPARIEHLLVPLDGTPFSERAVPYAAAVARATGASITLAHVAPPGSPHPVGVLGGVVGSIVTDAQHAQLPDMAQYLTAIREGLDSIGIEAGIEVVEAGSPSRALREVADATDADLVVMASRVYEGIQRRILGSVASDLIQRGATPVLVVPPLVSTPPEVEPSLARILVPLDGSLLAEMALAPAEGLLSEPQEVLDAPPRELALLYIAETRSAVDDGARYLEAIRDGLAALDLPRDVTITAVATLGSPPGAIVAGAAHGLPHVSGIERPYDLLVMATHGRGGVGRWLFGSVAEYVIAHSSVPVLITHPSQSDL